MLKQIQADPPQRMNLDLAHFVDLGNVGCPKYRCPGGLIHVRNAIQKELGPLIRAEIPDSCQQQVQVLRQLTQNNGFGLTKVQGKGDFSKPPVSSIPCLPKPASGWDGHNQAFADQMCRPDVRLVSSFAGRCRLLLFFEGGF